MQTILGIFFAVILVWMLLKAELTERKNARNEYRVCQYCGMRIPYKAGVCPYCHRRPGWDVSAEGRMFKKSFEFKFTVVFLIIMAICLALMYLFSM